MEKVPVEVRRSKCHGCLVHFVNRGVVHHVYVNLYHVTKFPLHMSFLFFISILQLVASRNIFSRIRIVLRCFYLLIFYFEKFST